MAGATPDGDGLFAAFCWTLRATERFFSSWRPPSGKRHFFLRRDFLAAEVLREAATLGLSIRKSSRWAPALMAAVIQRGCAPRPDQWFPNLSRYLIGALRPFRPLPLRPVARPEEPQSPSVSLDSWVFSSSVLRRSTVPTSSRSLKSASMLSRESLDGPAIAASMKIGMKR